MFVCVYVCEFIHESVCVSVCMSACTDYTVCTHDFMYICVSICLHVVESECESVHMSGRLEVSSKTSGTPDSGLVSRGEPGLYLRALQPWPPPNERTRSAEHTAQ